MVPTCPQVAFALVHASRRVLGACMAVSPPPCARVPVRAEGLRRASSHRTLAVRCGAPHRTASRCRTVRGPRGCRAHRVHRLPTCSTCCGCTRWLAPRARRRAAGAGRHRACIPAHLLRRRAHRSRRLPRTPWSPAPWCVHTGHAPLPHAQIQVGLGRLALGAVEPRGRARSAAIVALCSGSVIFACCPPCSLTYRTWAARGAPTRGGGGANIVPCLIESGGALTLPRASPLRRSRAGGRPVACEVEAPLRLTRACKRLPGATTPPRALPAAGAPAPLAVLCGCRRRGGAVCARAGPPSWRAPAAKLKV